MILQATKNVYNTVHIFETTVSHQKPRQQHSIDNMNLDEEQKEVTHCSLRQNLRHVKRLLFTEKRINTKDQSKRKGQLQTLYIHADQEYDG